MSKNFYADGRESVDTQRMTEAVFEANRQIAREKFDYKSGFVEWGYTRNNNNTSVPINAGLSTRTSASNNLILGS